MTSYIGLLKNICFKCFCYIYMHDIKVNTNNNYSTIKMLFFFWFREHCFPIKVPDDNFMKNCMHFVRNKPAPGEDCMAS